MTREELRRIALRVVSEGLRRCALLTAEAAREHRLAGLMAGVEGDILRGQATALRKRAASTRRLCWVIAARHGIDLKETGTGRDPRPVRVSATFATMTSDKGRLTHAL